MNLSPISHVSLFISQVNLNLLRLPRLAFSELLYFRLFIVFCDFSRPSFGRKNESLGKGSMPLESCRCARALLQSKASQEAKVFKISARRKILCIIRSLSRIKWEVLFSSLPLPEFCGFKVRKGLTLGYTTSGST